MSTTGGYTNTMFSTSTRPSNSLGRDNNLESSQKIEEEFSYENEKENRTLNDAIRKIKSVPDKCNFDQVNGVLCYPAVFQGSLVMVFEDNEAEEDNHDQNSIIEEEILDEEKKIMAKCLQYKNPADLECLRDHIYWGYFTKYTCFLTSIRNLFLSRISKVASNVSQRWYFGYLYSIYLLNLLPEKHAARFYIEQAKDLEVIVNHWKEWKVNTTTFPRVPRCSRQYIEIKTYEPAVDEPNAETKQRQVR